MLSPNNSLIDSHCHLDMDGYPESIDEIIRLAKKAGVQKIITIGIDLASSRQAVMLARQHVEVAATVGLHPHAVEEAGEVTYNKLKELARDPAVVGYGEIGLDYAKKYAPIPLQQREFSRQLEIARSLHLPVVIHDREAHADTLAALKAQGPFPAGGVMHCFSGDLTLAEEVLALDFFISIPGIVTFNNAQQLQEVVKNIPINRLLLETDAPFLAPVPWRGKPNMPSYLPYTAEKVANLKNLSIDEVAKITAENTATLFSLVKDGECK